MDEQAFLKAVLNSAEKMVTIKVGGVARQVPFLEALVEAVNLSAVLDRNARAQGLSADWIRQAEEAKARDIGRLNDFWEGYETVTNSLMEEAKQKGEPIPDFLPHPDDIVLDHREYPHFIGPYDENELKKYQEAQRLRDVLLMQDVLDQRSPTRLDGTPLREPGGALLVALFLETRLPPRFRLGRDGVLATQRRCDRLTKRELLKSLYHEWRKLGRNVPRGFVFCDLSTAKQHLEFLADFIGQARSGVLDVEAMANGEFNAAALSLFGQHGIPINGL